MRTRGSSVYLAVVALTLGAGSGSAADFPSAVETVLMGQSDGQIAKLDPAGKRALIGCVNKVLDKLPAGDKRYVAAGSGFEDLEQRFGEVVMANRAKWKQRIAKACGSLALAK